MLDFSPARALSLNVICIFEIASKVVDIGLKSEDPGIIFRGYFQQFGLDRFGNV